MTEATTPGESLLLQTPPCPSTVLWSPLPIGRPSTRWLIRGLALLARQRIVSIAGLEHIRTANDPFILVLNHSTRTEALLVPALLIFYRGGRIIHFLADWNFRLIPGIGLIYRRAETLSVMRKSARPRVLNALKPLYRHRLTALEQARTHLCAGRSIGIFPEGTVNRDSLALLAGRRGAARLSLETGAPIIPVGIRFPHVQPGQRIGDDAAMAVAIGAPLMPPGPAAVGRATLADVGSWHAAIMTEISRLCGKAWPHHPHRGESGR